MMERSPERKDMPSGYSTIERGAAKLAKKFLWSENNNTGGNIRAPIILEPLNTQSIEKLAQQLKNSGIQAVKMADAPLSEILARDQHRSPGFLTDYLNSQQDCANTIILIRADIANDDVTANDINRFTLTLVENWPEKSLADFCLDHNVRLVLMYNEHDATKYGFYGTGHATIRPLHPEFSMIDTDQVEDPIAYMESRRAPPELVDQWRSESLAPAPPKRYLDSK